MASFHRFSALPTEIRQEIWLYCYPQLAVLWRTSQNPHVFKVYFTYQNSYAQPPCIFAPEELWVHTKTVRNLMRVSSEVRAMMSEGFPDSFAITYHNMIDMTTPNKRPMTAIIRFHRERDIVFIEDCEELMRSIPLHLARTRRSDDHNGFFENVRNVAVSMSSYTKTWGLIARYKPRVLDCILKRIHRLDLQAIYLAWWIEDWQDPWYESRQGSVRNDEKTSRSEFTRFYKPRLLPWAWSARLGGSYKWVPTSIDSLEDQAVARRQNDHLLHENGVTMLGDYDSSSKSVDYGDLGAKLRIMVFEDARRRAY